VSPGRSPTTALLFGLILTLATVIVYSWYITGQISGLRRLQADLTDRNRMASLQLLRIQNDLNRLGLTMRDMLEGDETTSVTEWTNQFDRIRADLDDALRREAQLTVVVRTPEENEALVTSVSEFWDASDEIFHLARSGREAEARAAIRTSLLARQAALGTAVGRLLIQNNESEEQTAQRVQAIYGQVQRQVYWFLTATLVAIAATSLYLIHTNRQLFARLASLSEQRREVAQHLIAARESTLREISRELHDEFGQILTAIGLMLGRAGRQAPEGSPVRAELREIGEIAQTALDSVRGLSQTLHPSILEELGLESTIDWYIPTAEKQLGIRVAYQRSGTAARVDPTTAIHVYRVLQEAVNNVARHSGADRADVRLRFERETLALEVEDRGRGLEADTARRGLGLVAMRERAALLGGTIEFLRPREGGTLVRLRVPLIAPSPSAA
jgi:signal transduction histidine kinase